MARPRLKGQSSKLFTFLWRGPSCLVLTGCYQKNSLVTFCLLKTLDYYYFFKRKETVDFESECTWNTRGFADSARVYSESAEWEESQESLVLWLWLMLVNSYGLVIVMMIPIWFRLRRLLIFMEKQSYTQHIFFQYLFAKLSSDKTGDQYQAPVNPPYNRTRGIIIK